MNPSNTTISHSLGKWSILDYRNEIYGICALWIMLFHLNQKLPILSIPILKPMLDIGSVGVDVFMLLSGYCLCLSFHRNPDLSFFYKKRMVRVVLPYLVFAIPFYLWKSLCQTPCPEGEWNWAGFLKDLSGVSFWTERNLTAWFIYAIIFFYLIFPLIYKIAGRGFLFSIVLLLVYFDVIILASHYFARFKYVDITAFRFPSFFLGVIMAYHKKVPPIKRWVFTLSAVYLLIWFGIYPIQPFIKHFYLKYTWQWTIYFTMVIPLIYCMYYLLRKCGGSKFLLWAGGISLEIYLAHYMLKIIFSHYMQISGSDYWFYPLLIGVSLPLAWGGSLLSKKIFSLKNKA